MRPKISNGSRQNPDILVSDLDGTFIPLPDVDQNEADLRRLSELIENHGFTLIFATGRSFSSVLRAIEDYQLPTPDWIICNVGTSIYKKSGNSFSELPTYQKIISEICGGTDHGEIKAALRHLEALQLQSEINQATFKISYSCEGIGSHELVDQINKILQQETLCYSSLAGFSPQSNREMIDVLPKGVNKAYALDWLSDLLKWTPDRIFYAGDSGNDLAALTSEYASVLVGNAKDRLRLEVRELLKTDENSKPCYFAKSPATSGVLEGMRYHQMIR